jgi:hypothetical protein
MERAFCTIEEWKSALMILPDGAFFDLLRSVFGNIKTPFNKQRLLAELSAFFSRDEIRKNISRYIDRLDAKVIAAVAALGKPSPAELTGFFAGDINQGELEDLLLNLEERFILFRFRGTTVRPAAQGGGYREEPVSRLALNPALESVLAPFAADRPLVFPSVSIDSLSGALEAGPVLSGGVDDRILAALISFAWEQGNLFRAEGRSQTGGRVQGTTGFLRKKVRETGERIFPGLDLEAVIGGFFCLGIFLNTGNGKAVDEERLTAFRELSPRDRLVYCAAGICCRAEGSGLNALSPHLSRGRIRFLASLIHSFLGLLDPSQAYPRITLRRYADMLLRDNESAVALPETGKPSLAGPPSSSGPDPSLVFDNLLAGLEIAGLLRRVSDHWLAGPGFAPVPAAATPALAMDAPFSFVICPGVSFADALELASFALVREAGTVVRFELNRESAVRGFDRGIGAVEMGELLARLSGNRLEDTLLWTLKDWEKRYGEVSLYEGIVLSLSPERCYLAEAEPVASLVRQVLAPGVFLLSAKGSADLGIEAAAEALRKAGVDIVAQYGNPRPQEADATDNVESSGAAFFAGENPYRLPVFPPPHTLTRYFSQTMDTPDTGAVTAELYPEESEALKEQFRSVLGNLGLLKAERDELSARIERRLVLSESQLSGVSVRYEKLEARGIDYVGKALIAKQAIASKSLVEVSWSGDSAGRVFGIPIALEKRHLGTSTEGSPLGTPTERKSREGSPLGTPTERKSREGSPLESVLVLEPSFRAEDSVSEASFRGAEGNLLHIPLGKISLLRRIKKSIFET